ncbi:MAG: amino acid ABC transporter permease [Bacillota bacterium]
MKTDTVSRRTVIMVHAVMAVLFVAFMVFVVLNQRGAFDLDRIGGYGYLLREGFLNTVLVSLGVLFGSMVTGFLVFLLAKSGILVFQAFVNIFTEVIYGTPLLVMIIIMAFVIGPSFGVFNRPVTGILGMIVYFTPYMSNIFKSSFSSITKEQYMAMDLFGFTSFQKYRYIIIPQVIRILMPPLMNNFSLIIKGSALLNVLSFRELFYAVDIIQSRTFAYTEGYIVMWALYIIITIPLSQFVKIFERKWALK